MMREVIRRKRQDLSSTFSETQIGKLREASRDATSNAQSTVRSYLKTVERRLSNMADEDVALYNDYMSANTKSNASNIIEDVRAFKDRIASTVEIVKAGEVQTESGCKSRRKERRRRKTCNHKSVRTRR